VLGYCNFYVKTLRDVVTLTHDLSTLESCHVMPLGWSIPIPNIVDRTTLLLTPPTYSPLGWNQWKRRATLRWAVFISTCYVIVT